ncbi:MAG: hypothetical protein CME64_00595 [Halobacteriovoraceae bacterium]|nr:hypothetical protein [Halobacteriovoraceae bacterium]|tara:strand:- start:137057 stop:138019 length:963 start_codon:yes stop_codon:yes gene_type:complete
MKIKALLWLPIFLGVSCSSVDRVAVNTTAKIMEKGSGQINYEPNWHLFKDGAPANIKMIEGLSFANPDNERLLAMLAKSYGGYAFGVLETQNLNEELVDSDNRFFKDQAISAYTKSLNYGLAYLEKKGISKEEVFSKNAAQKLPKLLESKLDPDDKTAVFFAGQSLGGLINLQKGNVLLLSRIGSAKAMMDWVCKQDMNFEGGACYLFYALYEASRPAMLGGDLEKGKRLFKKFIKDYPHNLLGRVSYIQYYIIPMMDEVEYAKQREALIREFAIWQKVKNAGAQDKRVKAYKKKAHLNLFNAIAHERFKIIENNKENIF